jgi:tripartite ATP-independent transporter DctP family solute receptor
LLVLLIVVGCSSGSESQDDEQTASQNEQETIVLKLNTIAGPNQAQVKGYYAASDYIKEKTNGVVDLQVFHSGQLGSDVTTVLDAQEGQFDIAVVSPTWMGDYYPPAACLEAPYVIRDFEHLKKVLHSEIGKGLLKGFEDAANVNILDSWYFGTRHVLSKVKATTPEEFNGIVFRVPNSPLFFESAEVFGAQPTPLAQTELYVAFQTGTVDATFLPFSTIREEAFYEITNYIMLTGDVVYSIQPIINKAKWDAIPQNYQQIILEGFEVGREVNDSLVLEAEQQNADFFREAGIEIIEVDTTPFKERAKEFYAKYEDSWGKDLVNQIQQIS